ncbi:biotin/lipoyl-binding protein [Halieaceae bacterium IMCC14734]|uniref:Biotin/lipoyl-binding protein n=1 Tax=Candidatus Litorirhabdus singularis TaxID=2518993 RepID=A0ABT3TDW9_9GAMM|nr:biotin/lipoyl-binding protein [Candidatus Litorirhabdus singularis]MCX2980194.1 biotin/lipoyl-binding protein [Candidatus Litorirhabdus singularis]
MIVFLTLIYVAILLLLVKLGVVRWTLFWKLSPALWMIMLTLVLFLPLQFYAPSGPIIVLQPTVQIVPPVDGLVESVAVKPNQRVERGDTLFVIEQDKYQAAVDRLEADIRLTGIQLAQAQELFARNAGRQFEIDRRQAQLDSLQAQLRAAQWDLEHTVVRAPGAGTLTGSEALQVGARVVSMPFQQTMAFLDDKRVFAMNVQQIYLRHIEPGQPAEVTFKVLPGEIFSATVELVIPGNALGQVAPTGSLYTALATDPMPFGVRLVLDDSTVAERLPAGAVGTAAIYSGKMSAIYIIRRVMMGMDAWLNFVIPA